MPDVFPGVSQRAVRQMENKPRVRITNTAVEEAKPRDKEYVMWDQTVAGFGLRVRPTGGKSFIFTYRTAGGRAGKVQRVTIGNASMKVDPARAKAKELAGKHHGGADPAKERAEERKTIEEEARALKVSDLLDLFVAEHVKPMLKPSTTKEYERLVEKVLKPSVGRHKTRDLSPAHVSEMYHRMKVNTPTQAAHAVRVLSSAAKLAEEWGLREPGSNPCKIRLQGSRRRERLFSNAEVARLQAKITEHEAQNKMTPSCALALRLLFETGCRAGEICDLQWSNVDLVEGEISWPSTKTGSLTKAITSEASKLFKAAERYADCDYVCPSPALKRLRVETLEGAFERVMKAAKVPANENATLHLIRHWFATRTYSDASIALNLQMRIVGHKSVATAMRYAHAAKEDLKRATLQAEKKRAAAIRAAEKAGKIIPLPVREGR